MFKIYWRCECSVDAMISSMRTAYSVLYTQYARSEESRDGALTVLLR